MPHPKTVNRPGKYKITPGGTVPRSVFPARHAGLRSGGMGTVSDDI